MTAIRQAVAADLPRLLAIRDASGPDALSDPALLDAESLARMIAAGAVTVWDDGAAVAGFAAVEGAAIYLLAETAARGKGIGRELLADACARVRRRGCMTATLSLAPGAEAARHYRAAGWIEAGYTGSGGLVLKKPL